MKVWVIQVGEPLPIAQGRPRPWRSGQLAQALVDHGHDVLWWASNFEHKSKSHLFPSGREVQYGERLNLYLLDSPGYRRNVSLLRVWDHHALARNFCAVSERYPVPDVIHCGYPPIELAAAAVRYGQRHGVPVILDTRDQWPDLFFEAMPRLLRPIAGLVLRQALTEATFAFRNAAAISGHAPGFVQYGLRYASRAPRALDAHFPFSYPTSAPSAEDAAAAAQAWKALGLDMTSASPVFCYLGAFGDSRVLDLGTVIRAARDFAGRGDAAQFVLCGDGPQLPTISALAADLPNVIVSGWVDSARIWTLLRRSTAGLMPYHPTPDFAVSLPNKVPEYLSAGLPVVTSLNHGYAEQVLREGRCGVFYRAGDASDLSRAIHALLASPEQLARMREDASQLFDRSFRADRVSAAMVKHVECVAREGRHAP